MNMLKVALVKLDRKLDFQDINTEALSQVLSNRIDWININQDEMYYLSRNLEKNMLILVKQDENVTLSTIEDAMALAAAREKEIAAEQARKEERRNKRLSKGKSRLSSKQEKELQALRAELGEDRG